MGYIFFTFMQISKRNYPLQTLTAVTNKTKHRKNYIFCCGNNIQIRKSTSICEKKKCNILETNEENFQMGNNL